MPVRTVTVASSPPFQRRSGVIVTRTFNPSPAGWMSLTWPKKTVFAAATSSCSVCWLVQLQASRRAVAPRTAVSAAATSGATERRSMGTSTDGARVLFASGIGGPNGGILGHPRERRHDFRTAPAGREPRTDFGRAPRRPGRNRARSWATRAGNRAKCRSDNADEWSWTCLAAYAGRRPGSRRAGHGSETVEPHDATAETAAAFRTPPRGGHMRAARRSTSRRGLQQRRRTNHHGPAALAGRHLAGRRHHGGRRHPE